MYLEHNDSIDKMYIFVKELVVLLLIQILHIPRYKYV